MKRSTKNAKSSKAKVTKKVTKVEEKKPEVEGLAKAEQPLFYFGPPPAIRALYSDSKYRKDFHPQDLLERMRRGETRSEICGAWGITYSRLNDWVEKYAELAEAFAVGKPAYDAYYKRALRDAAFCQSKKIREPSLFFMLKNQVGFSDTGGDHEFADSNNAELEFVYE